MSALSKDVKKFFLIAAKTIYDRGIQNFAIFPMAVMPMYLVKQNLKQPFRRHMSFLHAQMLLVVL